MIYTALVFSKISNEIFIVMSGNYCQTFLILYIKNNQNTRWTKEKIYPRPDYFQQSAPQL